MVSSHDIRGPLMALLYSSPTPVSVATLGEVLGLDEEAVADGLAELRRHLEEERLGLVLNKRRDGVELVTQPAMAPMVRTLRQIRPPRKLSPAAKETLFIVMRRGPVTKREIQEIRDPLKKPEDRLDVGPVLKTLKREGLVVKVGHGQSPGKPALYRATAKAQERFPIRELVQQLLPVDEIREAGKPLAVGGNPDTGDVGHPTSDEWEPDEADWRALAGRKNRAAKRAGRRSAEVEYFELEAVVLGVFPKTWRRFLLPGSAMCQDLHEAIRDASGSWDGDHLWAFYTNEEREIGPWEGNSPERASDVTLEDLFAIDGPKVCLYKYDFGDDWGVRVELQRRHRMPDGLKRKLLSGGNVWPPEDCGGPLVWGRRRRRKKAGKFDVKLTRAEFDR